MMNPEGFRPVFVCSLLTCAALLTGIRGTAQQQRPESLPGKFYMYPSEVHIDGRVPYSSDTSRMFRGQSPGIITSGGTTVIRLPQDGMPCVIPPMNLDQGINAESFRKNDSITVGAMPNPGLKPAGMTVYWSAPRAKTPHRRS